MRVLTNDPVMALVWWQNDELSTILTNGLDYRIARDLEPETEWRIISPEELEALIQAQEGDRDGTQAHYPD